MPVVPDAPACCPGLSPIGCDEPDPDGMCSGGCDGAAVCAHCGDRVCGLGENACNCPEDCADAECVAEGDAVAVVPGAAECCPGSAPIPCDAPDADGVCMFGCVGAMICADCGDGVCGSGENDCNCPLDCLGGMCKITSDCFDHPAPIRCVGQWRCDPAHARPASHFGDDGCAYTCDFDLPGCVADGAVCDEGDLCRPCPSATCEAPLVCLDFEMAHYCNDDAATCVDLPHDDCEGAFACADSLCEWRCN